MGQAALTSQMRRPLQLREQRYNKR